MHTAKAGAWGAISLPMFFMCAASVNFFLFFAFYADCHLKVEHKSVIMLWSMRENLPSHTEHST
jgi:hypothetical protein